MATIGELIINVKAGTASFAGDLTRVKNLSFDTASQIQRSFSIIGTAAVGMLAAFGASMAAMVDKTTEFEVHILHLSESAGVTTETMSALSFASKMLGLDVDQVAKAMERFDKQVVAAQQGKGAAIDIMKTLGIDPATLKTSDEALALVAKHFAQMPDGIQKTGEAMAAFGKAGAAIIPMLKDLAEGPGGLQGFMDRAKALGLIMDKETGEAALRFQQNLTLLGLVFQGISMDVMKEVLPSLTSLTDSFVKGSEAVEKHRVFVEVLAGALRTAASAGVILLATVADLSNSFGTEFAEMRLWGDGMVAIFQAITAAARGDFAAAKDFIKQKNEAFRAETEAEAEGAAKSKQIQSDLVAQLKGIWSGSTDQVKKNGQALGDLSDQADKASAAEKKLKAALEGITASLKLQNETFGQSKMDIELTKLHDLGATYKQLQPVLAAYIALQAKADGQAMTRIINQQQEAGILAGLGRAIDEEGKAIEDLNRASEHMPDFVGTFKDLPPVIAPATFAVQDLTDKLNEQIKTFGKSDAELQIMGLEAVGATRAQINGVIAIQNQLKKLQDSVQGVGKMWKSLGDTMARDFADMIVAGKSFNAVLQDILKSMADMLMKKALFGDTGGAPGGGGGIFGAISGLIGGLFSGGAPPLGHGFGSGVMPMQLNGLASGGDVSAGQAVMVGEQGPEIFRPDVSGTVIPNGQGGGDSSSVTINYNIDARGADPGADRRIRQAIQDSQDIAVRRAMAGTHDLSLRTG